MASVKLTNAQVLALPTTAVQLVAAPGAAKVIVPVHALVSYVNNGDCANIDPTAHIFVASVAQANDAHVTYLYEQTADADVSYLLANGGDTQVVFGPRDRINQVAGAGKENYAGIVGTPLANLENAAVNIYADNGAAGNFTGGNPANSLTVWLSYYTATVT